MATRQQIVDFLNKLLNQPGYRAQVQNDPVGTLTAAGFTVTAADIPAGGIVFPSDALIQADVNSLAEQIELFHNHYRR